MRNTSGRIATGGVRQGRQGGFSLPEMLISVAVIGIATLSVLPSVGNLTSRGKVEDMARQVQQSLQKARSNAISNGNDYVLSFTSSGWNLFNDLDNDGAKDSNEPWLYSVPFNLGKTITWSAPAAAPVQTNAATATPRSIRYQPLGTVRVAATTTQSQSVLLGDSKAYRRLTITTGGAVKVERWIPGRAVWEVY